MEYEPEEIEGEGLNLTPEEQADAEDIAEIRATEKIEQEKIGTRKAELETIYPGILLPDADFYPDLESYDEDIEEIVKEADGQARQKAMDADMVGEAVARRVRGPQTPDEYLAARYGDALTREDWEKVQAGHDMAFKVQEFADHAKEAEDRGDEKEAAQWRKRMAFFERDLQKVTPLDAVQEERKAILDTAEQEIQKGNRRALEGFNRDSDAHHLYLPREDIKKSPFFPQGARIPGDEEIVKVPLGEVSARDASQAAKDHNRSLVDHVVQKGFVGLEKVEEPPEERPGPSKPVDEMSMSEYKKFRAGEKEG